MTMNPLWGSFQNNSPFKLKLSNNKGFVSKLRVSNYGNTMIKYLAHGDAK